MAKSALPPKPSSPKSLAQLLHGDTAAVAAAAEGLRRDGFVWLQVDSPDLVRAATPALAAADAFLSGPGHGTGTLHALEGHFSAARKDGFRLITGAELKQPVATGLPAEAASALVELALQMDKAQLGLLQSMADVLFKGFRNTQTYESYENAKRDLGRVHAVGQLFNIPLASDPRQNPGGYGLLDVVRYAAPPGATAAIEVEEHVDPGLFVLSLPASAPGLQLRNAAGEWVAPPPGCGVLWTGQAAADAGLAPGVHRVVAGGPRLSVWHELCTWSQLAPPMLRQLDQRGFELKLGHIRGTEEVLAALRSAEDHVQPKLVQLYGMPVGKARVFIDWQFREVTPNTIESSSGNLFGHSEPPPQGLQAPPGAVEIVEKETSWMPEWGDKLFARLTGSEQPSLRTNAPAQRVRSNNTLPLHLPQGLSMSKSKVPPMWPQ